MTYRRFITLTLLCPQRLKLFISQLKILLSPWNHAVPILACYGYGTLHFYLSETRQTDRQTPASEPFPSCSAHEGTPAPLWGSSSESQPGTSGLCPLPSAPLPSFLSCTAKWAVVLLSSIVISTRPTAFNTTKHTHTLFPGGHSPSSSPRTWNKIQTSTLLETLLSGSNPGHTGCIESFEPTHRRDLRCLRPCVSCPWHFFVL